MKTQLMLFAIAFSFAAPPSTTVAPPRRDKNLAQRERDVAEFARLLARNDIADLPAYFSFWKSSGLLLFSEVKATPRRTFRVATVIYPVPGIGDHSHLFIFADDAHCILHTEDTPGLLHFLGFVDLTGDGRMEKVAVFPVDQGNDGGAVPGRGRRIRVWSFSDRDATLILDAVFSSWEHGDGNSFISAQLVPPADEAPWSILLKADTGKTHGRFYWSKEKRAIVHEGLDESRCQVQKLDSDRKKLDSDRIRVCPMHPDLELTREEKVCPLCGKRLPE